MSPMTGTMAENISGRGPRPSGNLPAIPCRRHAQRTMALQKGTGSSGGEARKKTVFPSGMGCAAFREKFLIMAKVKLPAARLKQRSLIR